jgi:type I restriction enzyme S subunit
MSVELLLKEFHRISEAPDALPRLKRFFLDLAIRGKLTSPETTDEPASTLLKRISVEKAKRNGKDAYRNGLNDAAAPPFQIPQTWVWTVLESIGLINPKIEAQDSISASFVPMPMIFPEYGKRNEHEIRRWAEIKKGFTHFAEGDVGLAKITPCFENAKSTVFRGLTGGIGAGTTELHVVRPIEVVPEYILIFLKTSYFIDNGIPKMTGTAGQKRVPRDYFAEAAFPLPPLDEQHRIVKKTDELLALCGQVQEEQRQREARRAKLVTASLASLTTAPDEAAFKESARFYFNHLPRLTIGREHIQQLRQATLELGMRGKLVRQNPAEEPAIEILRKIAIQMGTYSDKTKPQDSPNAATVSGPFELPKGWAWARFAQLGKFGRGRSRHRPRNDAVLFEGGTHLFVQTGDVARSRGFIRTFTAKYNDKGLAQSAMWPAGTLCITIAANIADSGILSFDACFPDSVVGFVPSAPLNSAQYFEYFMRTAKAALLDFAPATAQKNINLGTLDQLLIPLPPLAELGRIVTKLNEVMTICDDLESQVGKTSQSQACLLEATLRDALSSQGIHTESVTAGA